MTAGNHWMICIGFIVLFCPLVAGCGSGGDKPPYLDTSLSIQRRVDDLVGCMTLEEKASQMLYNAAPVERLGIPEYNWWNECLHGVARAGRATVFPQAIGMAATWDQDLMHRVATVISDEGRAKHHEFARQGKRGIYQGLTFWTPNINIFRDPRWGRGMETYGEDPYLTGSMGVAFIKGIQGDDPDYLKAVATVKHFAVHSGPESERHTFDAVTDERDLRETYLPHFKMCIEEGGAYSLMGAYNRYLGEACCASDLLLGDILRGKWGFDSYVVSDCWALHDIFENHKLVETPEEAAAMSVKAGCDLNCGYVYENLVEAVNQGLLTEADIDTAVKRLFTARFRLGMFDPPENVTYAGIPYSVVDSEPHRELAREMARKSVVILKNDGGLLPLKKDIGTIAVIGPNADEVEVLLANYNGRPTDPITPLRGIREKVAGKSEVLSALGCEWAEGLPKLEAVPESSLFHDEGGALKPGLQGEYFKGGEFEGDPVFTQVDGMVDFDWGAGSPGDDLDSDDFGVRWSGFIVPKDSGRYALGAFGSSGFRLFFEEELMLRYENPHEPRADFDYVDLEAGKRYTVRLDYYEKQNDAFIFLLWSKRGRDLKQEALDVAGKADAVIMVMGLSPRLEGEEMKVPVEGFEKGDRIDIGLPDVQTELMKAVHALGKPTVLVLLNGSAVSINWAAGNIPAIVEAWYPGQAGDAIADVLFGDTNPGGRLPVTFYKSVDQLPPFREYAMKGRTYRYFEGEPLFPFGHGLSYTSFSYGNIGIPENVAVGKPVAVSVDVENTGKLAGEEVVQLYITDVEATVPVPIRTLAGFDRIRLEPGEMKRVLFTIRPEQFSVIDTENRRVIEPGVFAVSVGGKQPGFTGVADAPTTGVMTARLEVTGDTLMIE